MDFLKSVLVCKWQVVYCFFLCSWGWVSGQLRYSIAEEADLGTLVGNVAEDLGLKPAEISARRLNLGHEENKKYFALNKANGALTVNQRIDRERLCESNVNCLLYIRIITENPLELFNLEVEVLDINDNSPSFLISDRIIEITEVFTSPGARFPLEIAQDLDVGINGVTQYTLNPNPYFSLSVKNRKDGTLISQLVLEKPLDREEKEKHKLTLTAIDGGDPIRSGSCQITVIVLDINDNTPVFDQSVYKIRLKENIPLKTVIITLNATDADEGANGEIEYSFDDHTSDNARQLFDLNGQTGEISIKGTVDFEEVSFYELSIRAVDKGLPRLEGSCLIQVEIEDINDNSPEITFTSMTNEIAENVPLGTAVGFISVRDRDSGKNGEVQLNVSPHLPFKIKSLKNHFSLVTDGYLDREKISQYTIELTASDLGVPSMHTVTTVLLNVSDVNDNPPAFPQSTYNIFVKENNDPGRLLSTVSAFDLDEGINAELIYSIADRKIDGSSVSTFVYINPSNGDIYAQRSFDYEHIQVLQITVNVEDCGSPKLYSNASIFIFILDTNDNYPMVINSELTGEFVLQEKIQKAVPPGYLAAKISAVDKDSGHNAWLVFSLVEPINSSLFQVSAYTGEIRTIRGFQEGDNAEQQLAILIRDHGDPPLSTTVTVVLNIADDTLIETHKVHNFSPKPNSPSDLTLYLIISLVAISVVSIITFIILLVKCLRKVDTYSTSSCCFLSKQPSKNYSEQYRPTLYLNSDGTLKYMEVRMVPPEPPSQCYQTCLTLAKDKMDFTLAKPQTFPQFNNCEQDSASETNGLNDLSQAQPNTEWRFSQAQRPGPSGAQPTEEAGVWPNNQFETERLQAMILASANEAAEGTSGLGGGTGTMGLSARYGPQFTLQHVPDYRQNVYIPGSTLTPTNAAGKRDGKSGGNKKKSGKKEKK
ncbi:protocadherin gamma-C5-like isoform X11 [Spea bombifrons]|uniref:protocadherin gamma-C5-like isoform X11 n=1 Tax=Spea bombifrons TaxID=233779 RepID=UPI00234AC140|nr:protocadherin gamma-C5-like isoform X11 [Spea bombifrons]